MLDLGTIRPGRTIYIPFDTFAGSTGASITMTDLAVGDIKIYKDGSTTERASTSGLTLLDTDGTDFDTITGLHGFSINLADNTTAGFYTAGSRYMVAISSVTVDSQTVNFWIARFDIGYPDATFNTTIATLASQTSFTLTVGPAENNALVGCPVIIHDNASAVQWAYGIVTAYTGASRTITLLTAPTFTIAAGDNIAVYQPVNSRWIGAALPANATIGTATNVTTVNGLAANVVTATAINAAAFTNAKFAAGAIDTTVAPNLDATVSSRLASTGYTAPLDAAGTRSAVGLATANLDTQLAAIQADLDNPTQYMADVSALATSAQIAALNDLSAAEVNAEVDTALADYDGPTNAEMVAAFTEIKGATWSSVTDTLEAIRDRGDAAWITATGFSTLDAAGVRTAVGLASANLDTQLAAIQADLDNPTQYMADVSALATSAEIAALNDFNPAVDTVTLANGPHGGAAASITLADYSDFQGAAGDPWGTTVPGAYGVGTAGYVLGNSFDPTSDQVTVGTNNDKTGYSLSAAGIDAILDEPIAEPAGVFAWGTATLRSIIAWVGALHRNKMTQTKTGATTATSALRDDTDSANLGTASNSDDGTTFIRGEWS